MRAACMLTLLQTTVTDNNFADLTALSGWAQLEIS